MSVFQTFHVTAQVVSIAYSVLNLTYAFSAPLSSWLIKTVGIRMTSACGGILVSISLTMVPLVLKFWLVCLLFAAAGAGMGSVYMSGCVILSQSTGNVSGNT